MQRLTRAMISCHFRPSNAEAKTALLTCGSAVAVVVGILVWRGMGESAWAPRSIVGLMALVCAVAASAVPCSDNPFELRLAFSRVRIFRSHWWIGFAGWLAGLLLGVALVLALGGSPGELPFGIASGLGALIVPSLFGYGAWRVASATWRTALVITVGVFGCTAFVLLPIVGPEEAMLCAPVAGVLSVLLYGLGHRAAKTFEPGVARPVLQAVPSKRAAAPSRFPSVFPDLWLALCSAAWLVFSMAIFLATSATGSNRWWSYSSNMGVLLVMAVVVPGVLLAVSLSFLRKWLVLAPVALHRHLVARRCLAIFGFSVACISLLGALVMVLGATEDADRALRQWSMLVTGGAAVVLVLVWTATPGRRLSRLLSRWSPRWPISRVVLYCWFVFITLRSILDLASDKSDRTAWAGSRSGFDFVGLAEAHGWTISALLLVVAGALVFCILGNIRYATPPKYSNGKSGWEAVFDWSGGGSR